MDLFDFQARQTTSGFRPLAERMRPNRLAAFVGQRHIVGPGSILYHAIENDRIFSMLFWGPPGCGKTTLARIISNETDSHFVHFSAVLAGIKQIRSVIEDAQKQLHVYQRRTILFVDEIHRFNKAQQDAFLHHVESGLITLIGATTENPSFEVIPALMSRCRLYVLKPLSHEEMTEILNQALTDTTNGLGKWRMAIADDAVAHLVRSADGDARSALNNLEVVATMKAGAGRDPEVSTINITLQDVEQALQKKALLYDKAGESHYNLISAFHKSLRGSDPDAAIYWLARMLAGGEDPLFIARRMVRFASEDIGNADPRALNVAMDAMAAFRFIGPPEGELALLQAAVYLATSPKSNSLYKAYQKVNETIEKTGALAVPLHIRNAPTRMMKSLGYGAGYQYDHDFKHGVAAQTYLPEDLEGHRFYEPTDRGFEKTIKERMAWWEKMKQASNTGP